MTTTERIIDISKRLGLTHIGSNVSCLPILEHLYATKEPGDIVILDNAHAHLAHCIAAGISEPEERIKIYGIHCDRKAGCSASGGSLGHGIGIGIGYALAFPQVTIYVIVSDGSMMEGSNWEALRVADSLSLPNIQIHCNFNDATALDEIHGEGLHRKMRHYAPSVPIVYWQTENGEGFEGVQGHYRKA